MAVRGHKIRQTLPDDLPGCRFSRVTGFPGKGGRVYLKKAARVLFQLLRASRLRYDGSIPLHMGEHREVPAGGNAHQGITDIGVLFSREKLHQDIMGIRQRVELPFFQEVLHPVPVEELRPGMETHRNPQLIRPLLQEPHPAQRPFISHTASVRLLMGSQDDLRYPLHRRELRHAEALFHGGGAVIYGRKHMTVDVDISFFP